MSKKILLAVGALGAFTCLKAQDSTQTPAVKLSGSADMYYRYDLNNPKSVPYNNYTSFTNSQNSFELGMVSLTAEHTMGKMGMVADLGFGKRAEEFSYNDGGSSVSIKQLFITYAPSSKIKLTLGSWTTHIGYELVDANLNRNYSMSYLFSYGPFFHTGLKAEYALGARTTLMLGLTNPADLKNAGNLPKMMIAQLSASSKDEKLKAFLNYQGGKNNDSGRLYQGDLVLNYILSGKWSLGFNGTLQSRQSGAQGKWEHPLNWWGSALYIAADPRTWLGFSLRGEYFSDKKGALGFNTGIFETTFSANFRISDLTLIPEIRMEQAGRGIYTGSGGSPVKTTGSFLMAAVYSF
jgi:hypothetical protein